ncbi:MAG: tyrosine-type recombinase/integrase [Chloroflexi bacterium]|nr:tyrosine-type recombinase/integrase [Chloroflexota bacterium]
MWLDDYEQFLLRDRALADCRRTAILRVLRGYLAWQFRRRALRWDLVNPADLHRYALYLKRTFVPKTVNEYLSILRQFFRFMHMRGRCTPSLANAVPTVADFANHRRPEVLDDERRRRFLRAFDRRSNQGRRDYAMAVCLIDLGLRAIEVSRLRLTDIAGRSVMVPAAKASVGRQLPLPPAVGRAINNYLRHRPSTDADRLFVGESVLRGRPISTAAIAATMDRAYRRCGMVGYFGTHRLRHSFATRLFAHGATTKEIADLLGHRHVTTTDRYTQTNDLRRLAQLWPK